MAYIGKGLVGVLSQSKAVDTMTGDGSDTTLTLSRTPGSVNNVEVYMDGVFQTPGVEYTLSGNTVSFSTAPETGTEIIALVGDDSSIIEPNDASISGTKIAGAVVTDAKIAGMAANKLSGALPAVDGSALTNMPAGVTKSASDPAIDTNPAGGVGTIWANTTSGEMYVLTDATTDENVWFNVGGGDGDVQPFHGAGLIAGYNAGGYIGSYVDVIDKFSIASGTDSTDVGNILVARMDGTGQSSSTHGYTSGGLSSTDTIQKHSFTVDGNSTDVANLSVARYSSVSASSVTHGYTAGGSTGSNSDVIDKFTFSADADATDVGNLTAARKECAGQNSTTHGYTAGTHSSGNVIEKYSFTVDGNSTDVGDLTVGREHCMGQSSSTHGYTSGGYPTTRNTIDRFTFSSDANATDHGDLYLGRYGGVGQSSLTHGYTSGGASASVTYETTIDKFSFASNVTGTDVSDLTVGRQYLAGTQV